MIIQEISNETVATRTRGESSIRNLADDPNAGGTAAAGKAADAKSVENPKSSLNRDDILRAMDQAAEHLAKQGVALKFNLSEDSDELQVEVREAGSDKVIRKIPSDEVVRLSRSIKDMSGVFMDKPA